MAALPFRSLFQPFRSHQHHAADHRNKCTGCLRKRFTSLYRIPFIIGIPKPLQLAGHPETLAVKAKPLTGPSAMEIAMHKKGQFLFHKGFSPVLGYGQQPIFVPFPCAGNDKQLLCILCIQRSGNGTCLPQVLVVHMVDEANPCLLIVIKTVHAANIRTAVKSVWIRWMKEKAGYIATASDGQMTVKIGHFCHFMHGTEVPFFFDNTSFLHPFLRFLHQKPKTAFFFTRQYCFVTCFKNVFFLFLL